MDAATIWGLVITVVGTAASIYGAVISIGQASAAKNSADEAKRVRGQIVNQRKTSDLAELKVHCEKTIKCMEKYGPSSASTSLNGINIETDANEVQNLILEANKCKAAFEKGDVDVFVAKITPFLESFVDENKYENIKSNGKAILMETSNFLSIVRGALDTKRENIAFT